MRPRLVYDGEDIPSFGAHAVQAVNFRDWRPLDPSSEGDAPRPSPPDV
jgi:hypothetical protein